MKKAKFIVTLVVLSWLISLPGPAFAKVGPANISKVHYVPGSLPAKNKLQSPADKTDKKRIKKELRKKIKKLLKKGKRRKRQIFA